MKLTRTGWVAIAGAGGTAAFLVAVLAGAAGHNATSTDHLGRQLREAGPPATAAQIAAALPTPAPAPAPIVLTAPAGPPGPAGPTGAAGGTGQVIYRTVTVTVPATPAPASTTPPAPTSSPAPPTPSPSPSPSRSTCVFTAVPVLDTLC